MEENDNIWHCSKCNESTEHEKLPRRRFEVFGYTKWKCKKYGNIN